MGDRYRSLSILLLTAPLAACIPATAPSQPSRQPPAATSAEAPIVEDPLAYDDVSGGDAAPTWALQAVAINAKPVTATRYIVRRGDTLRAIGEMTGAGSEAIAMENDLAPPYLLFPGQELRVPAGLYHRVAAGETGIGIARAYGAEWGEIVTINALAQPYILRVGRRLRLPGDAKPQTPRQIDVAARAAAFTLDIDDIDTGSQPALAANTAPARATTAPRAPVTTAIAAPARFAGRFRWPIPGRVIAKFGPLAPGKVNDGINIAAVAGTPIHAAADGVVSYAGDEIKIYGGLILITHGDGWVSAYGHAQQLDVQRGQAVKAGDVIGLAGASGQVQSPQLHFQLRKNRIPVDPMKQLPSR